VDSRLEGTSNRWVAASYAAKKQKAVILSEAKNLSFLVFPYASIEEGFFASLRMTSNFFH